ncbi:hypothetical protein BOW53_01610 [Solemya pervernicosa gill symbiont]|uniref:Uncharacterized protein n=1 Tax=Solemya pervernicosa gill symbiont TaxID=642797 RepID=A0A1T2LAE6_9GAMM|nr:hypothetical protein BOW53_01610 [Solemya pervernicosa gill symbiont]
MLLPLTTFAETETRVESGDELEIVSIHANQCADCPTLGMTMADVEAKYGAPLEQRDAVGEPPISRWVFEGFTVYFERQYVLHSVVNRKKKPQ